MKLKKVLAIAMASMMVFGLTACGGNDAAPATTEAPAEEAPAEEAPAEEVAPAEAAAAETEELTPPSCSHSLPFA